MAKSRQSRQSHQNHEDFCLHGSPSVFTSPLPSSRVPFRLHGSPSVFTGPLPSSRVPFRLHGSPSVFTGPLPSSRVPFRLHGSPSVFTGPLSSSWDPSDQSLCVSKPSTYDFCQGTWSSGFIATQKVITIWVAMSMYCGFSHSTLACYAVTSWPPCHSTWVHVTVHGHPVTIHGPISLACYAHAKYMYCDMGHMTCDMSPCDIGEIYFDSVCTMILCMYCDSVPISACHSRWHNDMGHVL